MATTSEKHKIEGFILDCREEPCLMVGLRSTEDSERLRWIPLDLNTFLNWDIMIGVGDVIDVTTWTTRHIAHSPEVTLRFVEKGEDRVGAAAGVWIWLAALEMSLRRKLSELTYLGINNAETEKWTVKLGKLVNWQLNNGLVSYFGRLEPHDVVGVDQLYYVEKTQFGHRAWNRRGEVNIPDGRIKHSGIYFPTVSAIGGYRDVLYKP